MRFGLNLGSGPIYLTESYNIKWENSDFADSEVGNSWGIDKKRDFTARFDDLADNSVDYIVAWHIIEHLGLHERDGALREWKRVLKPTGNLFIACPDLSIISQHLIDRDGPWADWYICMVNVFGPYNGYVGDYHKWGYDHEELSVALHSNGYSEVASLNPEMLKLIIGPENTDRISFAPYNVQIIASK